MYERTHGALFGWLKRVQNKQCQVQPPPSLGEVFPARTTSWDPPWAFTTEKWEWDTSESSHCLVAFKATLKKTDSNCYPPTWAWQCSHPKAPWSGSVWLGFSVPLWQQIMLKWSLSLCGEEQKRDLAVRGEHTGSCPHAGHWACYLVVKITAGSQVGQVPSFLQLDLTLRDTCLHLACKCLSFLLLPLSPLVQTPKSHPVW